MSCSRDGTVKVWSIEKGQGLLRFTLWDPTLNDNAGHNNQLSHPPLDFSQLSLSRTSHVLYCVCFDEKKIYAGSSDLKMKIWNFSET